MPKRHSARTPGSSRRSISKPRKTEEARATWTQKELKQLDALDTPAKIQAFLDALPYDPEDGGRSVRSTLRLRTAHCLGGSLLAAYCLERAGFGPACVVGLEAENDDSHCIAVYKRRGFWGAVAKSNTTLLRSRDPVYPSLRALVLSYHDFYINSLGEKTLRAYTGPLRLSAFDRKTGRTQDWLFAEQHISAFEDDEHWPEPVDLLEGISMDDLIPAPPGTGIHEACFLGSDPDGLFQPE